MNKCLPSVIRGKLKSPGSGKTRFLGVALILGTTLQAQVQVDTLPFAISSIKKLSDEDLLNKKEGVYLTGIPDISVDPINGLGYGGEASLFFNGKKSNPFFQYTPYNAELDIAVFNTTKNQRELMFVLDMPYIMRSPWRLRAEAGVETNPNLLYFGGDHRSLAGLSLYPNIDSLHGQNQNLSYSNYESLMNQMGLGLFNGYSKTEYILNVSMERSFLESKMRALVGLEMAQINMTTSGPRSLLQEDASKGLAYGLGKSNINFFQTGLIYDTRDLETDPSSGFFMELTNELSLKAFGSRYNINKVYFHANGYFDLLKSHPRSMILALRVAGGHTSKNAPFFELQDQWSSEGSTEGLGGPNTLRGFKQSRFLGRVMTFNTVEMRCRIAQFGFLKQHFAVSGVPFFDVGSVSDNLGGAVVKAHYRHSSGLGMRIAWNVNTILRFDYAISKEDKQFFFNLGHAF